MNRFLAFAFVVAMIVAAVLGVKWRQAIQDAESIVRRAEREAAARPPVVQTNTARAALEVRRLEAEVQSLRRQLTTQRENADEVWRVQLEMLRQENASLQTMISNQMQLLANANRATEPVTVVTNEPVEPEAEEEDPGIGMTVVGMNEFRLMRWRRGTLPTEGAAVIDLAPGGLASAAGMQLGDIITSLDGGAVNSGESLMATLGTMAPGQVATLVIDRDRAEVVVQLLIPLEVAE